MRTVEIPNDHAIQIAEFLTKPAGKTLLSALYARRPDITAEPYASGVAAGWERAVDEIAVIAVERVDATEALAVRYLRGDDDNDPDKKPTGKV